MTSVYIEARSKDSPIEEYVVEDYIAHVLATFKTQ
jgi:hypothetical protein